MIVWSKEEYSRVTLRRKEGFFVIVLEKTSESPHWSMRLIDYDNNCGAIGMFDSEDEARENYGAWLALAKDAYGKKHAKYGQMPVITLDRENNRLVMMLEGERW